ncbi:MAG: DUF2971 domain-containing protein [Oscillospiraceae bacterium]|nr:DUF2971 domain-containing protein [Oscillospiraceae bacterium]
MNLYHFTKVDVLQKIIDDHQFYAFHVKYSNDHQEFDNGYSKIYRELKKLPKLLSEQPSIKPEFQNVIQKIISEIPSKPYSTNFMQYSYFDSKRHKSSPEIYFVCFTKNKESLSQWEMYAKETGVSIEFDFEGYEFVDKSMPEKFSKYCKKNDIDSANLYRHSKNEKNYAEVRSFGNEIHKVEYGKDDVKKIVKKAVEDVLESLVNMKQKPANEINGIIKKCFENAPLIKGSEHEEEKEYRLIFRPKHLLLLDDKNKNYACHNTIHHLNLDGVLTPYMKIAWQPIDKTRPLPYPIKSVTIGPGWNQDIVYKSVIHYLNSNTSKIVKPECNNTVKEIVDKWFKNHKSFQSQYMTETGILVRKSKSSHIFK